MYGTIARLRVKAGMEQAFQDFARVAESLDRNVPGYLANYLYQMDSDPREFMMTVVFASREAYHANAQDPRQHEFYLQLVQLLEREPEWHDGEIVWSTAAP